MSSSVNPPRPPVIDLSLFDLGNPWRDHVAAQIDWAASEFGLFHVVGHSVEPAIADSLREQSAALYRRASATQPHAHLYFGEGLGEDHARAATSTPGVGVHHRSANDYPDLPGFREAVLDYMSALTGLAHRLMTSFGRGLRLGDNYFVDRYTADPATRLHIVHQPGVDQHGAGATPGGLPGMHGAGGQTDAGLLTLIHQDEIGGFQVRSGSMWLDVPYVADSFVVAVGDALERLTSGRYAAAVRRTLNRSTRAGVALQFSFHPRPGASLQAIPLLGSASPLRARASSTGDRAVNVPPVMARPENVIRTRF
jgi:polar amino acid transport system ATP-binding protein